MKTSDYRGILFNFQHEFWKNNRDIIPAICYAVDRQSIVDAVREYRPMGLYSAMSITMRKWSTMTMIRPKPGQCWKDWDV